MGMAAPPHPSMGSPELGEMKVSSSSCITQWSLCSHVFLHGGTGMENYVAKDFLYSLPSLGMILFHLITADVFLLL